MGIDLKCGETRFGCSYGFWDTIIIDILEATFIYIECLILDDATTKEDKDELKELIKIKNYDLAGNYFLNGNQCTVDSLISWCRDTEYLNKLNYFKLGGLFALCNQSRCSGYYTPGNSLDICILLDTIKPNLKNYESFECIYEEYAFNDYHLYNIFEHSHTTKTKVTIW